MNCVVLYNWLLFSKTHYLSVIVQVLENGNRVTSHFYGLIPTGPKADAETQLKVLVDRFTKDGTIDAFKTRTCALVVDGAS